MGAGLLRGKRGRLLKLEATVSEVWFQVVTKCARAQFLHIDTTEIKLERTLYYRLQYINEQHKNPHRLAIL